MTYFEDVESSYCSYLFNDVNVSCFFYLTFLWISYSAVCASDGYY